MAEGWREGKVSIAVRKTKGSEETSAEAEGRSGGRHTLVDECPTCKRKYLRTTEQNAKLWTLLEQATAIDWYGHKLTEEEWKDVFTAALKREKVVPGINGGFVVLGQHTSKMNKAELSELIDLITAFLAEKA